MIGLLLYALHFARKHVQIVQLLENVPNVDPRRRLHHREQALVCAVVRPLLRLFALENFLRPPGQVAFPPHVEAGHFDSANNCVKLFPNAELV